MHYTKSATSIKDQIAQLQTRGLLIHDVFAAEQTLAHISYYRLAAYWWPLQASTLTHHFKPGARFETAVELYNFDRALRLLLFGVIERIEIGLRTKLIYHLSHEFDPWWFQDQNHFIDSRAHAKTLSSLSAELDRSKDQFIQEHFKKYNSDKRFPPAWKALEVATFGQLSMIYGNLKSIVKSKDQIAIELTTVNHTYLHSWLQDITQIRNICAHHGRLWNRNLPGRPKLLSKPPAAWISAVPATAKHHELYVHLCCMKYLTNTLGTGSNWGDELAVLLTQHPSVALNALGLPMTWQSEPLWK